MILTDEFARQASMEQELGIPSALFAAPVQEIIKLGKSQQGFMNMFAIPLFQGVTDVMPGMEFCVEELNRNKAIWGEKIATEQARLTRTDSILADGMFSPRQMSLAAPTEGGQVPAGQTGRKASNAATSIKSADSLLKINAILKNKTSFTPVEEGEESAEESKKPVSKSEPILSANLFGLGQAGTTAGPERARKSAIVSENGGEHINGALDGAATPRATETRTLAAPVENQRSSDTTEGSSSATGDWASQATYPTAKTPLSPSTNGTSVSSIGDDDDDDDSLSKQNHNSDHAAQASKHTRHASPLPSNASTTNSINDSQTFDGAEEQPQHNEKDNSIRETMRSLRKKPSRFRMMSFFKRSKSAGPPPMGGRRPMHSRGGPSGASEDTGAQGEKEMPWGSSNNPS